MPPDRPPQTTYLYRPSQFPEPSVSVNHINLIFDMKDDHVIVSAETLFTVRVDTLSELSLNARGLTILGVMQNSRNIQYQSHNNLLTVTLHHPLSRGSQFRLATTTVCYPTDNILEGLYYDITPAGRPRTIISQCQQWGFQRIAPCIDDMRAKCTWTATIIADRKYTNLITNGNILRQRTRYDAERDTITYQNQEPMPPYLFFLGAGTWDTFSRDFMYPDGRTVRLELLALPGSDPKNAYAALDILADAILWTHVFTGPERYDDYAARNELYRLCTIRFNLAKDKSGDELTAALAPVTAQIEAVSTNLVCGYQYPYEVYREIAMQNSDFGGMENTGNTTIIASRIMPDAEITDASYEYMLGVKQHEFYHNLNGSGVSGDTPFSIWLNEAVTVMMEDDYLAFHFGKEYIRLQNILQMYTPGTGTFSLDTGSVAMPIEPDGFNDPNDLITSVTYVKAPEFTRMIETMLGKEAFTWALDLYHKRFTGKNASPRDWLHAMEDVGRADLSFMADRWLKQTGYPVVTASAVYNKDTRMADIVVQQKGFGRQKPWIFPFCAKLVNKDGEVTAEFMKKVDAERLAFSVPCSGEFVVCIWNLNHAAYLKMEQGAGVTDDMLYLQASVDDNPVTRFLCQATLCEREMMRMMEDDMAVPSERLGDEYMRMLTDTALMEACGALPLVMFEEVSDPRFSHSHAKLYAGKQKIMRGIAERYEGTLYNLLLAYGEPGEGAAGSLTGLARRFKTHGVRNQILAVLAALDTPKTAELLRREYEQATCATIRLAALSLYLSSSAPDRMELLNAELLRSAHHPLAFENFIAAAAATASPDTVQYLKTIEASAAFHIEQAGCARSLYLRFAQNRKCSLETKEGREFLTDSLIRLAPVNAYITTGMLGVFSHMKAYPPELQDEMKKMLERVVSQVSDTEAPAVIQTIKQLMSAQSGGL